MDKSKPNILCISLTPALDHYVTADGFTIGKINRAIDVMERAGGKSINGARAIQKVGGNPLVISALGGNRGALMMNYAQEEGIDILAVQTEDETRQYTEIWDGISKVSTHISEKWSQITPFEWKAYIELIQEQISCKEFGAAVISGGMPRVLNLKRSHCLSNDPESRDCLFCGFRGRRAKKFARSPAHGSKDQPL